MSEPYTKHWRNVAKWKIWDSVYIFFHTRAVWRCTYLKIIKYLNQKTIFLKREDIFKSWTFLRRLYYFKTLRLLQLKQRWSKVNNFECSSSPYLVCCVINRLDIIIVFYDTCLLCILTNEGVLRMPFAGWYQFFNTKATFCILFSQ